MPTTARARALHWALVWAVVLAVVGMHHLGTHDATAHSATTVVCCDHIGPVASPEHEPVPAPGEGHDIVHLCLAVLYAALGLSLAVLLLRRRAAGDVSRRLSARTMTPRAPPPRPRGTPAVLASLCVLRL
ncbi:DUF6153 family protein [Saccharothrix stipae]